MLFLPECLGFMGDSAEHALNMADPPMSELLLRQAPSSLQAVAPSASFRRVLADTIESYAASPPGRHVPVDNHDDEQSHNDSNEADYGESSLISIIEELRYIARESNLWISGGGVHTKAVAVPKSSELLDIHTTTKSHTGSSSDDEEQGRKIYNTHVIIDDKGQIQAHYHKIHLFDVSIPGKVHLRESNTTSPGGKYVVCDSPIGKLGLSICYDMRFSEMYVDLVQKMGAQVLLMPSAFTVPTGKAHWHALLRARAIESQCYVLAAAQVGQHNEKRQSYGHSVVYDPWGGLVADAGGYDGVGSAGTIMESSQIDESPVRVPSIIISDIDLDQLASVRERMPIQQHRDDSSFMN